MSRAGQGGEASLGWKDVHRGQRNHATELHGAGCARAVSVHVRHAGLPRGRRKEV